MQVTCKDGTILQFPDDGKVLSKLYRAGYDSIYNDSSKLPREFEKYVVFRPTPPSPSELEEFAINPERDIEELESRIKELEKENEMLKEIISRIPDGIPF